MLYYIVISVLNTIDNMPIRSGPKKIYGAYVTENNARSVLETIPKDDDHYYDIVPGGYYSPENPPKLE